jgi:hypothetical protein
MLSFLHSTLSELVGFKQARDEALSAAAQSGDRRVLNACFWSRSDAQKDKDKASTSQKGAASPRSMASMTSRIRTCATATVQS